MFVTHSSDEELRKDPWLRQLVAETPAGTTFFTCDPRGSGETRPNTCNKLHTLPYGPDYFYASHGLMLDRPITGQRTHDVLRCCAGCRPRDTTNYLVAAGWGAVPATYAALLSDSVTKVTLLGTRSPATPISLPRRTTIGRSMRCRRMCWRHSTCPIATAPSKPNSSAWSNRGAPALPNRNPSLPTLAYNKNTRSSSATSPRAPRCTVSVATTKPSAPRSFFSTHSAAFVTGHSLVVVGGWTTWCTPTPPLHEILPPSRVARRVGVRRRARCRRARRQDSQEPFPPGRSRRARGLH